MEEDLSPSQASEARAPHRPNTPPHWEQPVPPISPRAFGRLVRPLVFTVGVSCCSLRTAADVSQMLTPCQFTGSAFGSAAIWQYESLKSRVQSYFDEVQADWLEKLRPQKRGDVRREVRRERLGGIPLETMKFVILSSSTVRRKTTKTQTAWGAAAAC